LSKVISKNIITRS